MQKTIIKETVRNLRKNRTDAEKKFWEVCRNRGIFGKKFLRQHPIVFIYNNQERFFIADFYYAEKKLIIEIDGKIHDYQIDKDLYRTYLMSKLGYQVVRIRNEKLIDIKQIIYKIREYLI